MEPPVLSSLSVADAGRAKHSSLTSAHSLQPSAEMEHKVRSFTQSLLSKCGCMHALHVKMSLAAHTKQRLKMV